MLDALLVGCRDLTAAAAAADRYSFDAALSTVYAGIAVADAADRRATMSYLGSHLERLDPEYASWAAVLAGALAENGVEPAPVVRPILTCLKTVAEAAAYFADAWQDTTDRPLPDPFGAPSAAAARTVSAPLGDAAAVAAAAWWSLPRWATAARAVLSATARTGCPGAARPTASGLEPSERAVSGSEVPEPASGLEVSEPGVPGMRVSEPGVSELDAPVGPDAGRPGTGRPSTVHRPASAPSAPSRTGLSEADQALLLRVLGLAAAYRPEPREVRDLLAAGPA